MLFGRVLDIELLLTLRLDSAVSKEMLDGIIPDNSFVSTHSTLNTVRDEKASMARVPEK